MRSASQSSLCWASSTLLLYNRMLNKLHAFCQEKDYTFPPDNTAVLSAFLCEIADSSNRPQSQLKSAMAAISHLMDVLDKTNLAHDPDIQRLYQALVKSSTGETRQYSRVMPIEPFMKLFRSWPENKHLDIKRLRLKAITLMSLSLMLRPSDIAPKGKKFNPLTLTTNDYIFSTKDIKFYEDDMSVTFHGIKNDSNRSGFQIHLPRASDTMVDPVDTLETYINRTSTMRPLHSQPVFISLHPPYKHLSAGSIALVLKEAIHLAGLDDKYNAKDFNT